MKRVIFACEKTVVFDNITALTNAYSFIGFQPKGKTTTYMVISSGQYAGVAVDPIGAFINKLEDLSEGSVFVFPNKSELLEWMKKG